MQHSVLTFYVVRCEDVASTRRLGLSSICWTQEVARATRIFSRPLVSDECQGTYFDAFGMHSQTRPALYPSLNHDRVSSQHYHCLYDSQIEPWTHDSVQLVNKLLAADKAASSGLPSMSLIVKVL